MDVEIFWLDSTWTASDRLAARLKPIRSRGNRVEPNIRLAFVVAFVVAHLDKVRPSITWVVVVARGVFIVEQFSHFGWTATPSDYLFVCGEKKTHYCCRADDGIDVDDVAFEVGRAVGPLGAGAWNVVGHRRASTTPSDLLCGRFCRSRSRVTRSPAPLANGTSFVFFSFLFFLLPLNAISLCWWWFFVESFPHWPA